jgi:hypothetical protein
MRNGPKYLGASLISAKALLGDSNTFRTNLGRDDFFGCVGVVFGSSSSFLVTFYIPAFSRL